MPEREFVAKGKAPPESLQRRLRAFVASFGDIAAARMLGISRLSVGRMAGGLPCWPATIEHVAARLAELQQEGGKE